MKQSLLAFWNTTLIFANATQNLVRREQRLHNSHSCPYFDGRHESQQDCVVPFKGFNFLAIDTKQHSKDLASYTYPQVRGQAHAIFIAGLPVFHVLSFSPETSFSFLNRKLRFSPNHMARTEEQQGPQRQRGCISHISMAEKWKSRMKIPHRCRL